MIRLFAKIASPFLSGAAEALIVNCIGLLAALAAQSVMAQALGAADFGVYSASVSIAAVLAVISLCGMDTALLREVPKQPQHTLELVRRAERGLVVITICAIPIVYLLGKALPDTFAIVILALFISASTIRQFALRANFMVFWGRFPDVVMRPVLLAGLATIVMSSIALRPVTALALHAMATAVAFLFGSELLKRRVAMLPAADNSEAPAISFKDRTLWLGLSLVAMLSIELDKLIGAPLLAPLDFGHYALASRLYGFGVMAMESLAVVAAPIASRLLAQGFKDNVVKLERELFFVLLGMVVTIFIVIMNFGAEIVAFLAPGFDDSVVVLKILSVAALAIPFVLPRLAITSVLNPPLAWKLQFGAVTALAISCFLSTYLWKALGLANGACGLAYGIVAGTFIRALIWRIFGRIV